MREARLGSISRRRERSKSSSPLVFDVALLSLPVKPNSTKSGSAFFNALPSASTSPACVSSGGKESSSCSIMCPEFAPNALSSAFCEIIKGFYFNTRDHASKVRRFSVSYGVRFQPLYMGAEFTFQCECLFLAVLPSVCRRFSHVLSLISLSHTHTSLTCLSYLGGVPVICHIPRRVPPTRTANAEH